MQLIACAERKPLRHRLNALAVARTDQPRHVERAHLSPCFVTQPIQKRLEPTSELVSPIRCPTNHGRPLQKADHPCVTEKVIWESRARKKSAKVVLGNLNQVMVALGKTIRAMADGTLESQVGSRICNGLGIMRQCLETQTLEPISKLLGGVDRL